MYGGGDPVELFEQEIAQMDRNRKRRRMNDEPTKEALEASKSAADAEVAALLSRRSAPEAVAAAAISEAVNHSVKHMDEYDDEYRGGAYKSSSMVVEAAGISSGSIHAVERPFSTNAPMYLPEIGRTSTGTVSSGGLGSLASFSRFAGGMTRGSNMNKTDETSPVAFHCSVTADFDDVPYGLQFADMPANFGKIYRGWQLTEKNFCFRSHVGRSAYPGRGQYAQSSHYTGWWHEETFRCLSWFYLNFELYARRQSVVTEADFHDNYTFVGFLQTLDAGDSTSGADVGASPGSAMATFHMYGRSRTPNIWITQKNGAGVKSRAMLWLILRQTCAHDEKGNCIVGKDGKVDRWLQVEPWAGDVHTASAKFLPPGTLYKWPIGYLNHTEGSIAPPVNKVHDAFYPKAESGGVVRDSLAMFNSRLPACVIDLGSGPLTCVG